MREAEKVGTGDASGILPPPGIACGRNRKTDNAHFGIPPVKFVNVSKKLPADACFDEICKVDD